jgi:DNA-binding MarR family transcriptional regulator
MGAPRAGRTRATSEAYGGQAVSREYMELTQLIERLHRRFLDVLRTELKRMGVRELNGVQALLLANIGPEEILIRDLIERGYYQGSNVSYNIKKLTDFGYIEQERAAHDKRTVAIRLTDKAAAVVERVKELEAENAERFQQALGGAEAIQGACDTLSQLERIWDDYIRYGGRDRV